MREHRVDSAARRARRFVVALGVALTVVVWNAVFDAGVQLAEQRYLDLQAEHQQGGGPAVSIRQLMDPAVRHAALRATLVASAPAAATVLTCLFVTRRRGAPSAVSPPT